VWEHVSGDRGHTWTELEPNGALPPARYYHSMVYDSARGQVVLFGGFVSDVYGNEYMLNDTWSYDSVANTWTEQHPGGAIPSARVNFDLVYDSASGRVILFGGRDASACLNDTWSYDPAANTWTELHPTGQLPLARQGHAMVYDPVTERVILFGGLDDSDRTILNDTWSYDPAANTWTELQPVGAVPFARFEHDMVYDPTSQTAILFGGTAGGMTGLNDTWAYHPESGEWTKLQLTGDVPLPRFRHAMAFDTARGEVIVFGGDSGWQVLDDIWTLQLSEVPAESSDDSSWTELPAVGTLSPPGGSGLLFHDSDRGELILLGGYGHDFQDIWEFDLATSTWTQTTAVGPVPSAERFNPGMVYDQEGRRLILYGGESASSDVAFDALTDTWVYEFATNKWSEIRTTGDGPACLDPSLVWDPNGDRLFAFGGHQMRLDQLNDADYAETMLAETWALDLATATWTNLGPAGSVPAARCSAGLVYDPTNELIILAGGRGEGQDPALWNDDVLLSNVWTYDPESNVWTETWASPGEGSLDPYTGNPVSLLGPAEGRPVFYDPALETLVSVDSDAIVFDPDSGWKPLVWSSRWVPERYPEAVAYDPESHRMFAFGGTDFQANQALNDLWVRTVAP
jgi:hypothetical protein